MLVFHTLTRLMYIYPLSSCPGTALALLEAFPLPSRRVPLDHPVPPSRRDRRLLLLLQLSFPVPLSPPLPHWRSLQTPSPPAFNVSHNTTYLSCHICGISNTLPGEAVNNPPRKTKNPSSTSRGKPTFPNPNTNPAWIFLEWRGRFSSLEQYHAD